MAASSSSQHRCVFVGNIPYDATEEQLIEICKEVGPVVSFRLVIDRETGKPKGYGFCEYKDEETALSARRNLQGYEINGRQLRVDFAESDKNNDKKELISQVRGGIPLTANVDHQKQGNAVLNETSYNQPMGLKVAINAANVMAAALGGAQSPQNVLNSLAATDPLTFHLSKMSGSQLDAIISDLKAMISQNKDAAQQLLLDKSLLTKAIFQAQIMLGMVTSQVLRNPKLRLNTRETSNQQTHFPSLHQMGGSIIAHNPKTSGHLVNPGNVNADNRLCGNEETSSKRVKLDDGRIPLVETRGAAARGGLVQPVHAALVSSRTGYPVDEPPTLSANMESALLQQVMKLTPDQINSLPPEQRQQVIQLQQALCREHMMR